MKYDFDLIVIGAGSGGVRCARIAASHGARVAVVEKQYWGGTCVNIGCVPKKLMVYASNFNNQVKDSHGYGWDTVPGHHHWPEFIEAKNKEIKRLNNIYISMLERAGVNLFTGHASFKDDHTLKISSSVLSDEKAEDKFITGKHIVIATGSSPTKLDIEGNEYAITSDEAFYLSKRPENIAIIGSGYIALEFAGIFAGLGSYVDLVYRQPVPLRGFDQDIRQAVYDAIEQRKDIIQHVKAHPKKIIKQGEQYHLYLDNGEVVQTDCVFFATGRHPNLSGLNLEKIGIEKGKKGEIIVNEDFETRIPHIYAIGDVIDFVNLTPVAIAQGHALADRLFGNKIRKSNYDYIPKAVFFNPPIGSIGLTEEEAALRGAVDIYISNFTSMRYSLTERKVKTFIKMIVDQSSQKVVGLHIVGDDAPEMLQGFSVAVAAGLTKAVFDEIIGIHPTSAEEIVTLRQVARVTDKQN